MSGLRRQTVTVELDGVDDPIELTLINPDFLRVERELPRFGLPSKPKSAPMSFMTSVAWAACKRLKLYDGELIDFLNRDCLVLDVHKDDADDEAGRVVPTTREVDTD